MKKTIITICIFIFCIALMTITFAADETSPQRIPHRNFEKSGIYTEFSKEFKIEWWEGIFPLYTVMIPPYTEMFRVLDNESFLSCDFLEYFYVNGRQIQFGWELTPEEIIQNFDDNHLNKVLEEFRIYRFFAISKDSFCSASLIEKAENSGVISPYPLGALFHEEENLKKELLSIDSYMVFKNQICQVQKVLPLYVEYEGFFFYYTTDVGNFVKYISTAEDEPSQSLLFTQAEFATTLETLYAEERAAWYEKVNDPNYEFSVGGIVDFTLIEDMKSAEMEIPYCEAGNPIPAHLQEEINALRGVDETTRTEDSDRSDGTTDGGAVTDVPTDEGVVDVSTETATLTDVPSTDGTADAPSTDGNASDAPLTDGTDAETADTDTPADPAPFPWVWVIVPAGVVLIAAATTALVIRKKKKL
ncbi:MAG: hypothetical protein J6M34_08240 [Clostridia bacterium]|nr:hypothetical protein [Clostridia bacterium]